jgi:hypothetical protein
MKPFFISLIVMLNIFFMSCNKQAKIIGATKPVTDTMAPPCILSKIEEFSNGPKQNPPAIIYSFVYNNQKVFFINAACCDQFSYVYDSNCVPLCAPDGGITGSGDGKCLDFYKTRTDEKLIWRDTR